MAFVPVRKDMCVQYARDNIGFFGMFFSLLDGFAFASHFDLICVYEEGRRTGKKADNQKINCRGESVVRRLEKYCFFSSI